MTTREQLRDGTRLFLTAVDRLTDEQFDEPTALSGWTRRHLVAHVHYNAEALRRLASWARTGLETKMYPSTQARAAEIEQGALLSVSELRSLVHSSADMLAADLDAMPDSAWSNQIATAQGRIVEASEIIWMRAREVNVHAVDLGTGIGFADLPDDFNAALVLDVVKRRNGSGEAAALAGWLTGRVSPAPVLRPWL